jgi:hypothetical protein
MNEVTEILTLEAGQTFAFSDGTDGARLTIQWTSKQQGIICDLDIHAFMWDERVSSRLSWKS